MRQLRADSVSGGVAVQSVRTMQRLCRGPAAPHNLPMMNSTHCVVATCLSIALGVASEESICFQPKDDSGPLLKTTRCGSFGALPLTGVSAWS
jgi:hypothetical protein